MRSEPRIDWRACGCGPARRKIKTPCRPPVHPLPHPSGDIQPPGLNRGCDRLSRLISGRPRLPPSRKLRFQDQRRDAADDRRVGHIEHVPGMSPHGVSIWAWMKSTTAPKRTPIDHVADRTAGDRADRHRHQPAFRPAQPHAQSARPRTSATAASTMWPQAPSPFSRPNVTPLVPHHGQVQHRQQHDLAQFRQLQHVQHPPFADLIGRQHDQRRRTGPSHGARDGSCRRPADQSRLHRVRAAQAQDGWAAPDPTSGSTRQQRAHLSPEAGVTFARGSADADTTRIRRRRSRSRPMRLIQQSLASSGAQRQLDRGLKRGADDIGLAGFLDRHGDAAADRADGFPFRGQRVVAPFVPAGSGTIRRCTLVVLAEAGAPGFLGGEAQHRRQPGAQAAMQMVQHGPRGAAAQAVRPVAVDRVLADVEIERRQVGGAEIVQLRIDAGPVVATRPPRGSSRRFRSAGAAPSVPAPACRRPARFGFGEAVQAAQHPAQRVAQPAVQFRLLLQDFRADPQVLGGIGRSSPTGAGYRRRICRRPRPGRWHCPATWTSCGRARR